MVGDWPQAQAQLNMENELMRIRTGYSFRNAVGHLEPTIAKLKEMGLDYAPITDTASTFGWVKWNKLCKKNGMKPIFGVELAVSPSIKETKPKSDHWTFLAIGSIEPINQLVELATSQFRYQPLLTYDQAMNAEGVFKIVGHKAMVDLLEDRPNLFVGLAPSVSRGYLRAIEAKGLPWVSCSDNRYLNKGDRAIYEIICGMNASTQSYPQWLMTEDEWNSALSWAPEDIRKRALINAHAMARQCNAELATAQLLKPTVTETLQAMCLRGAEKLGVDLADPVYKARLEKELGLIHEKQFEDYFYIVADICQWARQRMIVGPARGSSCGSLVCYLLEITTIDPIPYDLIFERFIDINRSDLPDIDIDFSDQKRQMVFDYIAKKYGANHVARLGTVAMYKPKSALKEAAGALDIPPWKLNAVLDAIVKRSGGDSRALQATEDTLKDTEAGQELIKQWPEIKFATDMEGHPRHSSMHAAGIVLTDQPISMYAAYDSRSQSIHCDKKDAEELNLLKIDALGLTQLSVFEDALELIGKPLNFINEIPLDDPVAFEVLNKGQFSGIFQFNGLALQSVTQQVRCAHIEDIITITALARPGPMNTGGTNHWIKVKTGREPITYPHPTFEPYLQQTLGVVAYQEQVMNIGREIGDLSWGDVTALRKAMSKSLGKEYFDQYGDRWKAGAMAKGVPKNVCDKVWDDLCAYGSWAFNRSHAVAYGLVSYYCCWLKGHYPLEFAAATLSHTDSIDTQIKMLRELHREGISYTPADKKLSTDKWVVGLKDGKKQLVGPLTTVVGIGPKIMNDIIHGRKDGKPMPAKAEKFLNNPKTKIDSIWPIGDRFKQLLPDPAAKNIHTAPTPIDKVQVTGQEYDVLVFAVISSIKPKDENEQINVAKRGYKVKGPSQALNLRLEDDTDAIFAKINRYDYEKIGKPIVERGRSGKALYAIKGKVPRDFRMISVKMVRYIGDMDKDE